jgi:hypothetical protein
MKTRNLVILIAWLLCIGAVAAVLAQRNQLASLRAGQVQTASGNSGGSQAAAGSSSTQAPDDSEVASAELLQLRSKVTQLTARKRELAKVVEESESLKAQLAAAPTNSGGLPVPGYIRRNQAQFLGYSTPENTVQSWLWALQTRDVDKVLQAFSPDEARSMEAGMRANGGAEQFFRRVGPIPGFAIQSREILPDGSSELQVYIAPQLPPQKIELHLVNGEWKMSRW